MLDVGAPGVGSGSGLRGGMTDNPYRLARTQAPKPLNSAPPGTTINGGKQIGCEHPASRTSYPAPIAQRRRPDAQQRTPPALPEVACSFQEWSHSSPRSFT